MAKSNGLSPNGRPESRRSRGFSFRSNKSSDNKLKESSPKVSWPQPAAIDDTRLQSKIDPNKALYESQPMDEALTSQNRDFQTLRTMQHKDIDGRLISEPDRSNPTRHRFERPLDTIRALESRVDRTHDINSQDSPTQTASERRQSQFYASRSNNGSRLGLDQYHTAQRQNSYRPPSMMDRYGTPNRMVHTPSPFGPTRQYSDPHHWPTHRQNSIYPSPAHQNSYDTVPSAEGSYNTDVYGASTDPSSESSSIHRRMSGHRYDGQEHLHRDMSSQDLYSMNSPKGHQHQPPNGQYGPPQHVTNPNLRSDQNHPSGLQRSRLGSQPPFSNAQRELPKVPIKLGGSVDGQPHAATAPLSMKPEKRKSWLKRTLSRK